MRKSVPGFAVLLAAAAVSYSIVTGGAIGLSAALAASSAAANPNLPAQTSSARGVTIKVTPKNLASNTGSWEFAIVLDTHSQDLSDDLVKSSLLLDGAGGQHSPTAWDGAPPGGHHREGVLRFKPISPRPRSIELQITRAGEDAPRSFRWQLK
ncbi:MAG: hypothetical protein ACXWUU_13745 [Burkholderiales bacterium]